MHIIHINLARGFRGGERQTALLIEGLAKHYKVQQTLVVRHDSPLCNIVYAVPGLNIHKLRKPYVLHLKQKINGDIIAEAKISPSISRVIILLYKFSSANDAKRLRTTPFKLIVVLPGKSLNRSTI